MPATVTYTVDRWHGCWRILQHTTCRGLCKLITGGYVQDDQGTTLTGTILGSPKFDTREAAEQWAAANNYTLTGD